MNNRGLILVPLLLAFGVIAADAQEIRNYDVNYTSTAPTIDGVVSPGEWDSASSEAGDWRELRKAFTDVDEDNNRFRILYDDANLYILYESDYDFGWSVGGLVDPDINFNAENLNIYIDPNQDGDLNVKRNTDPVEAGLNSGDNTDAYQLAFNQFEGTHFSDGTSRGAVGFYTEAHVNTPFGDQAEWNEGGSSVSGAALTGSGIQVAQVNDSVGGTGVAEIVIPFADFDANEIFVHTQEGRHHDENGNGIIDAGDYTALRNADPDGAGNPFGDFQQSYGGAASDTDGEFSTEYATGLNVTDGVEAGDVWGFNMSMITRDTGSNFLPIWNWHDQTSFAYSPLGTLTFQASGASAAIPEPTAAVLAALAGLSLAARRR